MATAMLNARIWYHDQALSTQLNAVALDYTAEELDATVLTDTTRTRAGGHKDAQAALAGFWESVTDKQLFDQIGNNRPLLVAAGASVGDVAYGMVALHMQKSLSGEHGELLGFAITLNSGNNGPLVRGQLMENAAITSSGNGTGRQLGAPPASSRIYSGIHVTAFNGTSLDIDVESDDNSGFTSASVRDSHTQITGLTSEWIDTVGPPITDDWWRYSYTFVGTSVSLAGIIGFSTQT